MAELLLGQPLFPGESGVDQLVEIIKVPPELLGKTWMNYSQAESQHCMHDIKVHLWLTLWSS